MITVAVDLGGTTIKLGVVRDGKVAREASLAAESRDGLLRQLREIADEIGRLLSSLGLEHRNCNALGLTFPGLVDVDTNRVRATYGKWDDAPGIDLAAWAK
ncbi:MAG TPA: hypothetical protein VKB67_12800, partial [Rhizomicrobium sp.]|nr:hypothetical protein [Rhizomicrobium sp.]